MKNKIFFRGFCCSIICLMLFTSNCFAITHTKHWWGDEYQMENSEIAEFRLAIQDLQTDKVMQGHYAAGAAAVIAFPASPAVSLGTSLAVEGIVAELSKTLDHLITELERWELRGKAIIVHIPTIIHGWSIKEK